MSAFSISVKNRVAVQQLRQGAALLEANVDAAVERTAIETGRELRREAPKAHTTLTNSITHEQVGHAAYKVGPHVDYASAVVKGSLGGGAVPFQVIFEWVKVKRLSPNQPGWTLKDLAWVIQKKILMRGTPANPFVDRVADSGFPEQTLQKLLIQASQKSFNGGKLNVV
jgi:hypothetical protein